MQSLFEKVQDDLLLILEDNKITYQQLKRAISTYPSQVQVQLKSFKTLKKISEEVDFEDIFSIWNREFVWSFLDVSLLEHIVKRLGDSDLQDKMREYSHRLQKFRKTTTVFTLVKLLPNLKPPDDYEACKRVIAELDENPDDCTLERLELIRKHACDQLKGYILSQVSLVLFRVKYGTITLVFIVHDNMVQSFKEAFRVCATTGEFFKENNIIRLELDGEIFTPNEEVEVAS